MLAARTHDRCLGSGLSVVNPSLIELFNVAFQVAGFEGGLCGLLDQDPPPVSLSMKLMREEHFNVTAGFGKSDEYFLTTNYGGNRTNAKNELLHVIDPDNAPPVPT